MRGKIVLVGNDGEKLVMMFVIFVWVMCGRRELTRAVLALGALPRRTGCGAQNCSWQFCEPGRIEFKSRRLHHKKAPTPFGGGA